ncbi:radical SAM superfamily enzyme YgiQ (UPF0313 family) [Bradyrhizobium macuxiense]|uniref:Radical SAM superfamily enzyme YgiQ (UPF0313 family) n=1 Tax=Bradyrhizobium macuxiense TaxID=1755647 RepID=A0A560L0Q4_9BRAD|nr:radical SAM protein [Bradyrhizobium macuxiense]TWB86770.1 radical SAM superfamily enzyme YgiQ (UPF0313 family) [Bradyrhizobium macuxiense]
MPRTDLLLVNAPADLGKKAFDLAFPFQRRLNFGLLSLATVVRDRGFTVHLLDPQIGPERDAIEWLRQTIKECEPRIVGISCISGFSYPIALAFAKAVRGLSPTCPILIGGKDHVGQLGATVLEDCESIDIVVRGEGETVLPQLVEALLHGASLSEIPNLVVRHGGFIGETRYDAGAAQAPWTCLDYDLLPDSRGFAPSIEVSRGCSFGCDFCVSARSRIRRRTPEEIVGEAERLVEHWQNPDLRIYFETPMFIMTDEEIRSLSAERDRKGLKFTWRTETRVDYLSTARLTLLHQAGLRVLDLGVESGDAGTLLRMGKTSRPHSYLSKAKEVIESANQLGVIVKVNVLFYLGETPATILTTLDFLEGCSESVNCVSAYPLMLYPGAKLEGSIERQLQRFGASLITTKEWKARHLVPVNPSRQLTYAQAASIGLSFGKSFQALDTFYHQKTYGYFSPNVTLQEFRTAAIQYGIDKLPFVLTPNEAKAARGQLKSCLLQCEIGSASG